MNAFYQHHKDSISFQYSCFDRILLNGLIQPFQQPERVVGFFSSYRDVYPVTRNVLRDIAVQFRNWTTNRSLKWEAPILEAPEEGRRDDFLTPYFHHAKPNQVVAILKAREPARILVSIGNDRSKGYHLELKRRWVEQVYFYINDEQWGRMFVRVCPYFPFSARVYLNQHHWLANQMRRQDIKFRQSSNAFISCEDPRALQELADSLSPSDIIPCAQKWLAYLTPFFTDKERKTGGCQHRLFFAQVEYCHNLIFRRRAAIDRLVNERLLDHNRMIGQPDKIAIIYGRKITKTHSGRLQTVIEDLKLGNPVIRSHYKHGFIKLYVRDERMVRVEAASNNVYDYGVGKAVENLPELRNKLKLINNNYLDVQQDVLETFIDRGELTQLSRPTISANGKRIPGLKLDNPRQLALMQALVRFAHLASGGEFTTANLHPLVLEVLGCSESEYTLSSLRYDLSKLRAKGLVERMPRSRRYRLVPNGYRLCFVYLKLFKRIYGPLAAGLLHSFPADSRFPKNKMTKLDRLYTAVVEALDNLMEGVGLKSAA